MPHLPSTEATKQATEDIQKAAQAYEKAGESIEGAAREVGKAKNAVGDIGGTVGKAVAEIKAKSSANAGTFGDSSIIGKASKNVFEFPVFMSSSVPIDFATATNSLLEQIYASYLQIAISETPVVSASDVKSGNIFQNMKSDVTKYLEYTDMFYAHDACHNIVETDEGIFEYHMISVPDKMNQMIMEQLDYQPLSEFDHYFQESPDFDVNEITRLEKEIEDLEEEQDDLREKKRTNIIDQKETERLEEIKEELKDARSALSAARKANTDFGQYNLAAQKRGDDTETSEKGISDKVMIDPSGKFMSKDKPGTKLKLTKAEREELREEKEHKQRIKHNEEKHAVDMKAKAPQVLDETKIQKLNTMKPLMMSVGVKVMADNGGYVSDMIDFVIGVKTHCRVVPADVLPDVAEYPNKGQNILSRKARWRAGEIKFLDYLFSRKDKKQAAYDSKDPNRKWYHRLYTLAHAKGSSKVAKKITGKRSPNGLIPNATLVMTKADVDMIEATNGIDLLKGSVAKSLCAEMFLIAIVVIDTDAQSIKILLPDVNNDYEVHSLASVNKQLATLDTSNAVSREVTKMMHGR